MQAHTEILFRGLSRTIGNTPLLAIECEFRGRRRTVYAKSEQLNLTGSIKDRMALHVLRRAYEANTIQPGDTIVEVTSGNTGISFAAIGRALGHPVTIFMPDWMSKERKDLIRSFGARIIEVSKEEGGFVGAIEMADALGQKDDHVFLPHQFSNAANVEAHELTTGPELWHQLSAQGLKIDAFAAGVGTGGTVMGVARYLRSKNPAVCVHPVEPRESPTMSTGCKVGSHRIQGISDEFIPAIVDLPYLDEVLQVSDGDAILMARALASQLGLGVGISSGGNLIAALQLHDEIGVGSVVATVFPDDNKKYLSTALFGDEPVQADYVSPDVQLLSYDTIRRSCRTCTDADECEHWTGPHLVA